jgi:predicted NAD/FAD-dependent oxidoreductase
MRASPGADRTIVVGAGVAGLACARALADAGRAVTVLERARGVGGRCVRRRIEGQRVDFGVLFYHGRDAGFLAGLEAVRATAVPGWPRVVQGAGRPCQPEAFAPGERRLAFAEGVSAFPKHLAQGLDVRTGTRAISFAIDGEALRLELEGGETLTARVVVLALAAEQALALLHATAEEAPVLDTARALLAMVRSQPCLTLVAGYPLEAPAPGWDICYPEASPVLQALARDSAKRPSPSFHAMIYQATPRWSREHFGAEGWPEAILDEAARLLGPWAAEPRFIHAHRWRHARTDRAAELAAPLFLDLPGGARLGVAGEAFAAGGGVEAAWASGGCLARRILAEGAGR